MKKLLLLFSLMIMASCANKNKEQDTVAEVSNLEEVIEEKVDYSDAAIPVHDYEGLKPLLEAKNDTTYVVNFWATWCKPCIKEMPYFEQLGQEYADDKVKILFVSLDFPEKIDSNIVPFMEKNNIQSEVVLLDDPDANSWINKVSADWSGAIPATVIYKNDDRKFYERSFTYEELETELKSIL